MNGRLQLAGRFAFVGFVAAAAATIFLWRFSGDGRYIPAILGLSSGLNLFAFPVIGAALAGATTLLFNEETFGWAEGGFAAFFAFLAMCALVAGWGGSGVYGFLAFGYFGFLIFGWALVAAGMLVGSRYRASRNHAL